MSRRHHSLAGALYRRIVLAVGAIGLVMAALTFAIAAHEIDRDSDAELLTSANVLLTLVGDEIAERAAAGAAPPLSVDDDLLNGKDTEAFHRAADGRMFAIFRHGRPVLRSDTAPPPTLIPQTPGFHDFAVPGGSWRSYGLVAPRRGLLIVAGERLDSRRAVLRQILMRLVLPLLAILPITAIALHLSLRSGLASLRRLSWDLAARSSQDLSRLSLRAWPRDLSLLVTALNQLLERVDDALTREQGFTDDAAHQLRTPLAAIRIQAQALIAMLPAGEREAGAQLLAGIDRATALVDRMLVLARLEATRIAPRGFDACALAAEVIADHAAVAAMRDVEFDFACSADRPFVSDPDVLAVALAAVAENAVKYSPAGGTVRIEVALDAGGALCLSIADEGRGLPAADRDRLFERFARGPDACGGTGLGLTIAWRAMALLAGTIRFRDAEPGRPGLVVELTAPPLAIPQG